MTPWLARRERRPDADVQLYCFPHAGGGPAEYVRWSDALPGVQVWGLRPPGRESRLAEPPFTRMTRLVEAIVESVPFERPCVFFGHSLGALVAFEVARALRDRAPAPTPAPATPAQDPHERAPAPNPAPTTFARDPRERAPAPNPAPTTFARDPHERAPAPNPAPTTPAQDRRERGPAPTSAPATPARDTRERAPAPNPAPTTFARDPRGLGPAPDADPAAFARDPRGRGSALNPVPATFARDSRGRGSALNPVPAAFARDSRGRGSGSDADAALPGRGWGPVRLVVSGCPPPGEGVGGAPLHALPDAALLAEIERSWGPLPEAVRADPELLAHTLACFRADLEVLETYRYEPGAPLDLPITAFGGAGDRHTARLHGWRDHTTGTFDLRVLPGDHFYLRPRRGELLALLGTLLKEPVT